MIFEKNFISFCKFWGHPNLRTTPIAPKFHFFMIFEIFKNDAIFATFLTNFDMDLAMVIFW